MGPVGLMPTLGDPCHSPCPLVWSLHLPRLWFRGGLPALVDHGTRCRARRWGPAPVGVRWLGHEAPGGPGLHGARRGGFSGPGRAPPAPSPPCRANSKGAPCSGAPGTCVPRTPRGTSTLPPQPEQWLSMATAAALWSPLPGVQAMSRPTASTPPWAAQSTGRW